MCQGFTRKEFPRRSDILDVKYWISSSDIDTAANVAERAIRRNPQVAYYYYAVGLHANNERALSAVKKGLKAKQITPFVKHYLLWRAVDHSTNVAMFRLTGNRICTPEWEEGIVGSVDGRQEGPHSIDLGNVSRDDPEDEGCYGVGEAELDRPLEGRRDAPVVERHRKRRHGENTGGLLVTCTSAACAYVGS